MSEQREGAPPGAKQTPLKPWRDAQRRATEQAPAAPATDSNNFQEALDFLEKLRPGGSWVLTAIVPDGVTYTQTFTDLELAREFIGNFNGTRNLYYTVNPTRTALSKKPAKIDIAAVEYLLGDLDPREGETPEQAKRRYLELLKTFTPAPTVVVDSGNGIQCLWRLAEPIRLPIPTIIGGKPAYSSDDQKIIEDIEARSKALMERLGGVAGTQNVDRILRLPRTVNLPNKAKREKGRVECPTKLIEFSSASYSLRDFPTPEEHHSAAVSSAEAIEAGEDELERTIRDGGGKRHAKDQNTSGRSEAVCYVTHTMLRRGYAKAKIVATLLNRANRISDHVHDQAKPRIYAEKQVDKAIKEASFALDKSGNPYASQNNIRIGLLKLGVTVRYDRFADRTSISGLPGFGPILDDGAVDRLWLTFEHRFHFRPSKDLLFTVLMDTARLNEFHPVLDYLDSLQWDGVQRIDQWLTTYGGVEDGEYTRAVGALVLVAAVRRLRQPGCKFDEMVVLENPDQGTDKSSALATLAKNDNWFSDDLPLGVDGKRVIESLRGRWIVEAAELSGLRKADIEHLKAFLSRTIDRARMSYDRLITERPRQCVIVGSTNSEEYLRDTTGNRRFWPVRVKRFDIASLARDRDQLWAEAAAREAAGVSIRLDQKLWPVAAGEQAQRLTADPFFETLQHELNNFEGKISAADVWVILDVRPGQRTQEQNRRVGEAIRKLGWVRPSKSGMVRIGDKLVSGYVKGEHPWREVRVYRQRVDGEDQLTVCHVCAPNEGV